MPPVVVVCGMAGCSHGMGLCCVCAATTRLPVLLTLLGWTTTIIQPVIPWAFGFVVQPDRLGVLCFWAAVLCGIIRVLWVSYKPRGGDGDRTAAGNTDPNADPKHGTAERHRQLLFRKAFHILAVVLFIPVSKRLKRSTKGPASLFCPQGHSRCTLLRTSLGASPTRSSHQSTWRCGSLNCCRATGSRRGPTLLEFQLLRRICLHGPV